MQKIFKKSLALAVAAALCLTAFIGCLSVNAEGSNPSYVVEDVTGAPGATVKINVKGSNLTDICGQDVDVVLPKALTVSKVCWADNTEMIKISEDDGGDYNILEKEDNTVLRFVDIINFPAGNNNEAITTQDFDFYIEAVIPQDAVAGTAYDVVLNGKFANYGEALLDNVSVTNGKVTVAVPSADPSFVVSDAEGAPGETVTVNVKGDNLAELRGMDVDIVLAKGLEFVKAYDENGDFTLIGEDGGDYNLIYNAEDGTTTVKLVELLNFPDENPNYAPDFNIDVEIPADAKNNDKYDIILTGDFADIEEQDVTVKIDNGVVTVKAKEPISAEDLKIRSASITLENGFALNYNVRKSVIDGIYTNPYIVFKKALYNTEGIVTGYDETVVDFANSKSEGENYVFTLSGIYPQQLGSDIIATIYASKDNEVYVGATVEYSVLKFAVNRFKNAQATENEKTALADMLYYGEAVQKLSKYNTANMITAKATTLYGSEEWKAFATEEITRELVNSQTNTPLDGATVRIRSAALTLEDIVIMNFNCSDMGVTSITNPETYLLKVEYTDNYNNAKSYEIPLDSNGIASFDKLVSTELGIAVKATIINAETKEAVSNTVTYSIETYISKNLDNGTQGELCRALIKYGDSVCAYAGIK